MKSRLLVIFSILFLVLSLSLIYAQETEIQQTSSTTQPDVGQNLKTNLEKVGDVTESIMDKEISLPEPFDRIFQVLFNLEKTPTLQEFILLLGGFIVLFLIIIDVLGLIHIFDKPLIRYASAFIIVALVSISNGLDLFRLWVISLLNMFNSWVASTLALVISIVLIFFVLKLLKKAKEQSEIAKSEAEGMEAGVAEKKIEIKASGI
jgi:hypothetical protein